MAETKTRILVVDDDARLRELLNRYLSEQGYSVRAAVDGNDMNRWLARERYDLMVLDLMMPGEDGLSICRRLRGLGDKMPIIMLTAKGDDVDRIVGLEVGADDYLAKPFELRELLARVRAVLRRSRIVAPVDASGEKCLDERIARFVGLVLNLTRRRLESDAGEAIDVTGAEFNLLAAFVERANRVLSRDAIADLTRRDDWDAFDRSIDTLVSRLRRKLSPYTDATRLIQTVRSEGYVLAANVAWSGPPAA